MHEMRAIAIGDTGVCHFSTVMCKNDVLFGVEAHGDPKTLYSTGEPIPTSKRREFDAVFTKLLWPFVLSTSAIDCACRDSASKRLIMH